MTIDKRQLFLAAWAYARAKNVTFAAGLKAAWAHIKAAAVEPEETPISDKLDTLAGIVMSWPRKLHDTFAYRFVLDNAQRSAAFGDRLRLSEKQIAIINDLYSKHA